MKKKKIAILGSTGSIGLTTYNIIKKNQNFFDIVLLSTNKKINTLYKQAKELKVKNLIIINKKNFLIFKKKYPNFNVYNSFNCFEKIFKKKIDYVISGISGFDGLEPTLKIIKFTKKIAIANKESIICGWSLIKKSLLKYNTKFYPVDSEHFSIWELIDKNLNNSKFLKKVYITASGGPFYNKNIDLNKIKIVDAINHPNWDMGKKISIDSATMMNKIFELIEAHKIFDIEYNNIKILFHPKSYVHSIVKFKNGTIKILCHETTMTIPIINSLFDPLNLDYKTKDVNFKILNSLNFSIKNNLNSFPLLNLVKLLQNKESLYETVLVTVNDFFVFKFLKKEINFKDISKFIIKCMKSEDFMKFKRKRPKKISDIIETNKYVSLKLSSLVYKSKYL